MNPSLLKSYMVKNHDTQSELADVLGISPSTLNAKINGKSASFRQEEMRVIAERYMLSADEIVSIFFTPKLS